MPEHTIAKADSIAPNGIDFLSLFEGFEEGEAEIETYSATPEMLFMFHSIFSKVTILYGDNKIFSSSQSSWSKYHSNLALLNGAARQIIKDSIGQKLKDHYEDDSTDVDPTISKFDEGNLTIFLQKSGMSHKKSILLKSENGREMRTIIGSANFTRQGLDSNQGEHTIYCDSAKTYASYSLKFQTALSEATKINRNEFLAFLSRPFDLV